MYLHRILVAAIMAATLLPSDARAYPIDCAILLCLAGGWPPAAECAAARTEVIRRITPWPIEPPLQLWRCPMRANSTPNEAPVGPHYAANLLPQAAAQGGSILDEPAFAFLRGLRVYHIRFVEFWDARHGVCLISDRTRVGLYDAGGTFLWRDFDAVDLPAWAPRPEGCVLNLHSRRAVGLGWQAHDGTAGHEVIPY